MILSKAIANGTKTATVDLDGTKLTVDVDGKRFFADAEMTKVMPKGAKQAVWVLKGSEAPQMITLTEAEAKQIETARVVAIKQTPESIRRSAEIRYERALNAKTGTNWDRDGMTAVKVAAINAEYEAAKAALAATR